MEQDRDFKGVWIPKEIWLDMDLSLIEKIILIEVDSLDVEEEGCYASNKYLAEFCNCTETTISTSIKRLIELGYLYQIKFDGRKRYLKSALKLIKGRVKNFEGQTLNNLKADFKKLNAININNNIDNNIINNIDNNTFSIQNNFKLGIQCEELTKNGNKCSRRSSFKINDKNYCNQHARELIPDLKIKINRFKKPTLEEVEEYCKERNNNVDAKKFYDYYEIANWKDKDGKQVKNWKQKIITWEGRRQVTKIDNTPEWFNQDLKINKASYEEEKEMQNIINNY